MIRKRIATADVFLMESFHRQWIQLPGMLYQKLNSGYHACMDWTLTIGSVTFGTLDIITMVIVLIGAVSGCITGFARQVANLAGFVISIPAALLFTKPIARTLAGNTGLSPLLATLITFVALCLLVFIIIGIFGSMLRRVLETIPSLDHTLGFAWGLIASAVSLSIILAILNFQSFIDISAYTDSSVIIREIIAPLFPSLVNAVKGSANA